MVLVRLVDTDVNPDKSWFSETRKGPVRSGKLLIRLLSDPHHLWVFSNTTQKQLARVTYVLLNESQVASRTPKKAWLASRRSSRTDG